MQITDQLRSILTGTAVLGIAALVALYLTLARGRLTTSRR